jgi:hypothetical protein
MKTHRPSGWIDDSTYAAALLASIAWEHPRWTDEDLQVRTGTGPERLEAMRASQVVLRYPEQLILESLLLPATVQNLRQRYRSERPRGFWADWA